MSARPGPEQRPPDSHEVVAGRYELIQRLARGGMGEVFIAQDRSTGKRVALKRLLKSVLEQRSVVVHFMREYHVLSELRHPRIIEVYDYGVDHDTPYYTMELLDGQDLRDLSPLPYREACLYLRDVASSLALLHARRLLHRDISPRNVRRTSDGHCKLLDFGAMIAFGIPPNVTGTAPCVPPEALQGATLDQRADLYSLGALAYCVLTGRHAHAVSQLDELPAAWQRPIKRPRKRVADIPEALDELVMSLLQLDPLKRPKSAGEVIDWLTAIGQLPADDTLNVARSFLISSQLSGRDGQCSQITRHIKRAARGQGSAISIEGAVGSGKSRLLAESVLIAQTCGLTAVHAVARRHNGSGYALAQELVTALQQVMPLEAEAAGARRIAWPRAAGASHANMPERDPAELRARLQQVLTDVFCHVARARPMLLTIDDLDRADEFSAALVAGLAHQAPQLHMAIIASRTEGRDGSAGARAFRKAASALPLYALNREENAELLLSMFGNAPNLELLNDWMFRVARGNPKLTLELAEHLFKRGLVRYMDGMWVLPTAAITEAVPDDMAEAWALRIQNLGPTALALAELLSVRRGGASAELCLSVSPPPPESVFAALDELVRNGVLESAGNEYVFAQDALRNSIEHNLTPERRREVHRRWADALLASGLAHDPDVQLEAGWHLVHTADELAGADLLAKIGPVFVDDGLSMAAAIPALEKALEVYERLGRPLEDRLRLRSSLVLAGYLFDYKLAFRYGEETLQMLHRASGVALAARLGRWIGTAMGLYLSLLFMFVRRLFVPKVRRGPPVYDALKYFVRSALGLMGVRATALDPVETSKLLKMMQPLAAAPNSGSGRLSYLAARALALQMLGREEDHRVAIQEALRELRRGRRNDMSESEYRALLVGLITSDGINESYRESSEALARADLLDGIGTRLAQAGALRIRMIHYARRGDADRADYYRRQIELFAIQGGTTWQGEWFSVPLEGLAGATWSDLVTLRRSLDRLDRLVEEVPSLKPVRDGTRISYHFRRGEFGRAATRGMDYMAAHPPRQLVGWGAAYGIIALSLIEIGESERALKLCEDALAHVSDADRAYFVIYSPLEVAYATALALQGQRARADEIFRVRIASLRRHGEHASLVSLYQYQARMARLVGDREALAEALQSMRDAALTSGLPAVILLADRVAELRAKRRSSPLPPASVSTAPMTETPRTVDETAVTTFLRRSESGRQRSYEALRILARYVACDEAYLFGRVHDQIELIAAVPSNTDLPELAERVDECLNAEPNSESMEITVTRSVPTSSPPLRFRLRLLSDDKRHAGWIGAVALREGEETMEEPSEALLADIGRILVQDIGAEEAMRVR